MDLHVYSLVEKAKKPAWEEQKSPGKASGSFVNKCRITDDGSHYVTCAGDKMIKVWNAETNENSSEI